MEEKEEKEGTSFINIRVSAEVKALAQQKARKCNMSITQFVIKNILEPAQESENYEELNQKVDRLGDKMDLIIKLLSKS